MESMYRSALLQFVRNGNKTEPADIGDEVRPLVREVGVRNMFIQNKLGKLLGSLEAEGVTAVVLKGCHLIHSLYPFGIRPIEDIDLLLHRNDFEAADRGIRRLGYRPNVTGMDIWTHLHLSNKLTYIDDSLPAVPIDIHFSLGPYPYLGRLEPRQLMSMSEPLQTEQGIIRVLPPELLMLHLCLHLFQHHFEDWQVSGCDIAAVAQHDGDRLDWTLLLQHVRAYRLQLPVRYALERASELAGARIPSFVLAKLDELPASRLDRYVYAVSRKQRESMDRHLIQFVTTPGWRTRLTCAAKIAMPGRAFLAQYFAGSYLRYVRHLWHAVRKSM